MDKERIEILELLQEQLEGYRIHRNLDYDIKFIVRISNKVVTVSVAYKNESRVDTGLLYKDIWSDKTMLNINYLMMYNASDIFEGSYPLQFTYGGPYISYQAVLFKELESLTKQVQNITHNYET